MLEITVRCVILVVVVAVVDADNVVALLVFVFLFLTLLFVFSFSHMVASRRRRRWRMSSSWGEETTGSTFPGTGAMMKSFAPPCSLGTRTQLGTTGTLQKLFLVSGYCVTCGATRRIDVFPEAWCFSITTFKRF